MNMVSANTLNTVLLVQRDQQDLVKITEQLEKVGVHVRAYSDGREACTAISSGIKYNLGIFDFVCGDIHGKDVLNLSKAKHPSVPVIIYSRYNMSDLSLADDIIPKPMNILSVARKYI